MAFKINGSSYDRFERVKPSENKRDEKLLSNIRVLLLMDPLSKALKARGSL